MKMHDFPRRCFRVAFGVRPLQTGRSILWKCTFPRLPLFFITGQRFKRKLDEYLRARLRKGFGRGVVVGCSQGELSIRWVDYTSNSYWSSFMWLSIFIQFRSVLHVSLPSLLLICGKVSGVTGFCVANVWHRASGVVEFGRWPNS